MAATHANALEITDRKLGTHATRMRNKLRDALTLAMLTNCQARRGVWSDVIKRVPT